MGGRCARAFLGLASLGVHLPLGRPHPVLLPMIRSPHQVRVLLVVPSRLEHDTAWRRVRARPPDHAALNIYNVNGGERECYRVFRNIFFGPSEEFGPIAGAMPGALRTDAFWSRDPGRAIGELVDQVHGALLLRISP